MYAKGSCVHRHILAQRCPYGFCRVQKGFTPRARNYRSWIADKKKEFEGVGRLDANPIKLCVVGEYVYLPYSNMNDEELGAPFLSHSVLFAEGSHFMKTEDFTAEVALKLSKYRPRAMLGNEITSYQKEQVPQFLQHLKEEMPEMFAEVVKDPEVAEKVKACSNVGRKALLRTLRPGCVLEYRSGREKSVEATWKWDGEYLTSEDARPSIWLVPNREFESCHVKIKPKPDAEVTVTSEDQVTDKTEFVN